MTFNEAIAKQRSEFTIDAADFMSEHFGLEPDYFIALLNHVA